VGHPVYPINTWVLSHSLSIIRSNYFGFGYLSGFIYIKCSWFDLDGLFGEIFTFVLLPFIYLEAMPLFL
jgi:hypothetical protein